MSTQTIALKDPSLWIAAVRIGSDWRGTAHGAATFSVHDPGSGALLGTLPRCEAEDVREAVEAAAAAFAAWRRTTAEHRAGILERWHDLILDNLDDLACILSGEQGKPLAEAADEIRYAASFVKWFGEQGKRVNGYSVPAPTADRRIFVAKEPVGVCALITPWNFPAAMVTRKAAPALAAGCSVVIKPSELTPYTALALAALASRAGLPDGCMNVIAGDAPAIGAALTSHAQVRKLSFTGSTRVGALLMRQCADTIKKVSLELGGNAPFIVFDDADLDLAVAGVIASKYRNAGQTCVCANRILVQDGIHDAFVARLAEVVNGFRIGHGAQQGVTIGPLINAEACAKVERHLHDALDKGATLVARTPMPGGLDPQRYSAPALLTGADASMQLAGEETFGPLAPIFRFTDESEAIALANGTAYGLAGYFYSDNLHRAWRVAEALETGMVGINTGSLAVEMAPFGGIKLSGLGREGGQAGIEEYLESKAIHFAGLKA
ncbi:MAG: NAD-dependent succinate-semialdehyde dehydrogenase [Pseudoxanthomonas sp.]